MHLLASFYGAVFILAFLACALLRFLSPELSHEGFKRLASSYLLFALAGLLAPDPSGGRLIGFMRLALSLGLFLSSVACLFQPEGLRHILGNVAAVLAAAVIVALALFVIMSGFQRLR
jgi:hypothetical protein